MTFNIFRLTAAASTLLLMTITLPTIAAPIKNIVLVHGAFVDGSGWRPVYNILIRDGYRVSLDCLASVPSHFRCGDEPRGPADRGRTCLSRSPGGCAEPAAGGIRHCPRTQRCTAL